jgi:hypothetical protein
VANCIFCEQPFGPGRKRSGEHAFPKWVAKALPGGDDTPVRHTYTPFLDAEATPRDWVSKGFSLEAKVVCERCNNDWMDKTIERTARPHLWPMIQGSAVTLLQSRERVAYWALKTAMMIDMTHRAAGRNVPVETYPELYAAGNVLSRVHVWIGASDDEIAGHGRNGMPHLDLGDGQLTPMWMGLIGRGHLVLLVIRVQDNHRKRLEIVGDLSTALLRIWPHPSPVTWPPLGTVFDRAALVQLPIHLMLSDALKATEP